MQVYMDIQKFTKVFTVYIPAWVYPGILCAWESDLEWEYDFESGTAINPRSVHHPKTVVLCPDLLATHRL